MTKASDGRRNNKPPEHGKIKPREIRNPYGRRGKPQASNPNAIDEIYLKEGERIVARDDDGPVTAARRLVQEEFFDALKRGDPSARARVLEQLSRSSDRAEREMAEYRAHVFERRAQLENEFYIAAKLNKPAPDILPHPAHVHFIDGDPVILGPTTAKQREFWERLKESIKVMAYLHDLTRRAYRASPSEITKKSLDEIAAARRKLMRHVPKGWNWRENIWSRGSSQSRACPSCSP